MSLRAQALVKGNRIFNILVTVLSYSVLLVGLGCTIFREALTYAHYGQEDNVFGGARPIVGAVSNLFSTICQILFTFLFFYRIHTDLMAESPEEQRIKRNVLLGVVIQSFIILGSTIFYAIARPMRLRSGSSILPLIASLSCRFMLDFSIHWLI
jgi:hypothetical protein